MNTARSSSATKNKTERMRATREISGNWIGTVRAEWYTCTGDLIVLSGRVKSRIVVILDERNEGNTRSGGRLHYGDGG